LAATTTRPTAGLAAAFSDASHARPVDFSSGEAWEPLVGQLFVRPSPHALLVASNQTIRSTITINVLGPFPFLGCRECHEFPRLIVGDLQLSEDLCSQDIERF
jgi:hypothetical protein